MQTLKIVQSYLDEIAAAVMTGDWDTYRSGINLPCHIVSHDENKVISTDEDLKAGFDLFCDTLRSQRVTDYIRLVESATLLDQSLISGRYVTHLVAGSHRVMPPTKSEITLRLVGNRWRAVALTNSLSNGRWPLVRLTVTPDSPPEGPVE